MTVSAGLLLVFLATSAICVAGIVIIGRARRAARYSGDVAEGLASRADTQRLLAANWARVEQTARSSGMSEEEIERVRANVLGFHDG
ncbi:MAG: hypothetical protein ACTHNB_11795 [Gaiellaceae bacterium]